MLPDRQTANHLTAVKFGSRIKPCVFVYQRRQLIKKRRTPHHNSKLSINSLTKSHSFSAPPPPSGWSYVHTPTKCIHWPWQITITWHSSNPPPSFTVFAPLCCRDSSVCAAHLGERKKKRGRVDPLPFLVYHIQVLSQLTLHRGLEFHGLCLSLGCRYSTTCVSAWCGPDCSPPEKKNKPCLPFLVVLIQALSQ